MTFKVFPPRLRLDVTVRRVGRRKKKERHTTKVKKQIWVQATKTCWATRTTNTEHVQHRHVRLHLLTSAEKLIMSYSVWIYYNSKHSESHQVLLGSSLPTGGELRDHFWISGGFNLKVATVSLPLQQQADELFCGEQKHEHGGERMKMTLPPLTTGSLASSGS